MSGDQIASVLYLSLLGAAIAGYFLVANRHRMGQVARQAALWALIFVGAVAAAGLWEDIRGSTMRQQAVLTDDGMVQVPRARDGHFYLTLDVNGAPVRFMVDTGATDLVLSEQDAMRAGLHPEDLRYTGRAYTANGVVETAPVWLNDVRLGDIAVDRGVPAMVNGGEMKGSLLGMGYLSRFASLNIERDRLTLTR
ncbi:MAG: TIGR02281 family clan AA aspartic protease [Pseudomonadota bacterium]